MVTLAALGAGTLVPVRLDRPVSNGHGEIGTLENLFLDLEHNRIAYATVHLDGGSGDCIAVPWPEVKRDADGGFHLDIDPEMTRGAPRPDELADERVGDRRLRELYLYYGHVPYGGRPMR